MAEVDWEARAVAAEAAAAERDAEIAKLKWLIEDKWDERARADAYEKDRDALAARVEELTRERDALAAARTGGGAGGA